MIRSDLTPLDRAEIYDDAVSYFRDSSRCGENEIIFRAALAAIGWNASEIDAELQRIRGAK